MSYLKSVLNDDAKKEERYLKELVYLGSKLNINVTKYKKELRKFNKKSTKKVLKKQKSNNSQPIKKTSKKVSYKKYEIKNVYTKNNTIVVEYHNNIKSNYLRFFELNYNKTYKDVFNIKGHFKNAKPTKLRIKGIDKILIYQYKKDSLRITISNKKNLKTYYKINKNKIIISIPSIKITPVNKVKKLPPKKLSTKKSINKQFSIQNVYTKSNKIFIDFNKNISKKDIKFFEQHYKNLHKDVFNINGYFKDAKPTKLKIAGIDRITISQYKKNVLRIVASNRSNLKSTYHINKRQIIISFPNIRVSKESASKNISNINYSYPKQKKNKVVVIDAGHGGKDVGAVGPSKRYEKIVVLKVAKYLYNNLKHRGYKVYITRNNDRFIRVRNRTVLANKKHADIFISIHANAAHKSKVKKLHGIETFFLSPARSKRAMRVAAKENKSDMRKMNYSSKNTLLTILNQSKITSSNKLAIDVHQNMLFNLRKSYSDVVDGGVREGPFWVLVGAQMPSILVEIGYITHPKESQRLYTNSYQKKLAYGIANGIDSYFAKNP